jgi:hypothetical protein
LGIDAPVPEATLKDFFAYLIIIGTIVGFIVMMPRWVLLTILAAFLFAWAVMHLVEKYEE